MLADEEIAVVQGTGVYGNCEVIGTWGRGGDIIEGESGQFKSQIGQYAFDRLTDNTLFQASHRLLLL